MWSGKKAAKKPNNVVCMQSFLAKRVKGLNDQPKPTEISKFGLTWSFPDHEPA